MQHYFFRHQLCGLCCQHEERDVEQYDVPVEWQAVQHYLRRSASKSVVASSQEVLSNLARPGLVIQSVLSANVVLPDVTMSNLRAEGMYTMDQRYCLRLATVAAPSWPS